MTSKRYTIAKWFIVLNYFCIVFAILFVVLFVLNIISSIRAGALSSINSFIFATILIGGSGIYSVMILPRMRGSILVSDQGITQEFKDGSSIVISWQEPFVIKERQFLGRVDLIPSDKNRVIKIEKQIKKYDELMDFIWRKQGAAIK